MATEATEDYRRRIADLGLVDEAVLGEAVRDFEACAPDEELPVWLYRQGFLTREQVQELGCSPPRAPTTQVKPSKVGEVVAGCRIQQKLGEGGMGTVYLALRERDEELVVVKFLSIDKAARPDVRARFQREAEVLQKVSGHPNVVSVLAVEGASEEPHIVMEYVRGQSLEAMLEARWSLDPLEATRLARQAAVGLAEVHGIGIVHRDIKPANMLLDEEGSVRIVDFGLAKDLDADGLTQPGQILGTPSYMAPEQWGDHVVDAGCDIFALGATLYHMVVGEPPFQGRTRSDVAQRILAGEYTPPRRIVPGMPPDLELVIHQMLMPDRRYRYPTAEAAVRDLDRVLAREPVDVPRLEELGRRGRRHPLLPAARFTIGREAACDIVLAHPSISRHHAQVERESTGFVVRDFGSTYGSWLGSSRIRCATPLRDGDRLRLGRVELEYRDGGLTRHRSELDPSTDPRPLEPQAGAAPALDVLAEQGDPRLALRLVERLDTRPARREARLLARLLDGDGGATLPERVAPHLDARASRAGVRLLELSGEEREDDAEAWLAWWDRAQQDYPAQLVPAGPEVAARLRITEGGPEERTAISLAPGRTFPLGRSEDCHVVLTHRSVSRVHATVLRLHERWVLRDEGSRFGSRVNNADARVAFLDHEDEVVIGRVRMTFELEDPDLRRAGLEGLAVDPLLFDALLDLEHPGVATALVSLLHAERRLEAILDRARALAGADGARPLMEQVRRHYTERARRAREVLPRLLGGTEEVWPQRLAERRRSLPPQVLPRGELPDGP